MARVGEREFVVNAEVEDGGDKDNRLLRQPGKPLNQEADLSTRVLSRPKERKKKSDLHKTVLYISVSFADIWQI